MTHYLPLLSLVTVVHMVYIVLRTAHLYQVELTIRKEQKT